VLQQNWFTASHLRGSLGVIVFWSPRCHWCQQLAGFFRQRSTTWAAQNVHLVLIASNAHETEADLIAGARAIGYTGHLLKDREHTVANAFGAMTTPHSFIIDRGGMIVYQGGVTDRTFHTKPSVNHLDEAVTLLRKGIHPDPAETPAYGCAIVRDPAAL
jgi:peroxiredoxin